MPASNLQEYVGAAAATPFIERCWYEACELVNAHLGGLERAEALVPQRILDRAYLEVGSELFHRKNSPSGIQAQYATPDTVAPRLARDPMTGVYPILAKFTGGGFA